MLTKKAGIAADEERTARLTILIDPRKKVVFEELCAAEDLTPSQIVRGLIRRYIEERLGRPWTPERAGPSPKAKTSKRRPARRRAQS